MSKIAAADRAGLIAAAAALRDGAVLAMPTETVYGLAADARNSAAVSAIYALKSRPRFNPLIAHVAEGEAAQRQGRFTPAARALADAFWPGPLTLIVPARADCEVCDLARAGLDSVALRVPSHPIALALLEECGFPLAAPSANRSGRVSPTTSAHVLEEFPSGLFAILEGGPCAIGIESTILRCDEQGIAMLRPGAITRDSIEAMIGPLLARQSGPAHFQQKCSRGFVPENAPVQSFRASDPTKSGSDFACDALEIQAPGQLASHYAPRAALRLDARQALPGEAHLGFGAIEGDLNLSPSGDLAQAAANLFGHLRALDARGPAIIAIAPIPEIGLGEAILDRLRRAAAPRGA